MPPLATSLFDYDLPAELIAQTPTVQRDRSRLLVVDRTTRAVSHHIFAELPHFLRSGDTLFRNTASVLPARLHARRPSGGHVECFLLRAIGESGDNTWQCLVRPGKKLPPGSTFAHPDGAFRGEIVAREPDGSALVRFTTTGNEPIAHIASRLGDVPLPPYITRRDASERPHDLLRYQTVYADHTRQVAVAAPTAGLHFTPELLDALSAQGVRSADITLHVGLGTFKPITSETIEAHPIHRETYELPAVTQRALFPPLAGRRVAVGTTSVRAIEHFLSSHDSPTEHPHIAEADTFVYPPRDFRGIDVLITNFHQPRSTLLCLVAAFLTPGSIEGIDWLRSLYKEAIERRYRFFSYGDAMLIL